MYKKLLTLVIGLFALIYLAALAHSFEKNTKADEVTIEGVVAASAWDDDDNVTSVAIIVSIEVEPEEEEEPVVVTEEYLVEDNDKGRELLSLVDQTVEATGEVTEDEFGTKSINITSYKVVDEE